MRQVTGEADWPDYLEPWIKTDVLEYFCNTRVQYEIRGVQVALETSWDWEAEAGDHRQTACYCDSRARLVLRQGAKEGYRSELYVVPTADIAVPLEHRVAALQAAYPGIALTNTARSDG